MIDLKALARASTSFRAPVCYHYTQARTRMTGAGRFSRNVIIGEEKLIKIGGNV
ncbi:MAG: hypothetical protein QXP19_04720 [Thermoproteota archaeon]